MESNMGGFGAMVTPGAAHRSCGNACCVKTAFLETIPPIFGGAGSFLKAPLLGSLSEKQIQPRLVVCDAGRYDLHVTASGCPRAFEAHAYFSGAVCCRRKTW